jgi:glycerol-3-phosphate dehydrogenase (NAD(P)+)
MQIGILGNGSWGTALAKIVTDRKLSINWWIRSTAAIKHIELRHHNPNYLSSAFFDISLLKMSSNVEDVIRNSDAIVICIPSAYVADALKGLPKDIFEGKKIISAVKGILPEENILLNDYLALHFGVKLENYFTLLGPCHAEEVAAEKLSYLTFSGVDVEMAKKIADCFHSHYINTVVNPDVLGVQYAAVLKNIYALGSGIAHGLDYGDNFLSVLIANAADEMAGFLRKLVNKTIEVGHPEEGVIKANENIKLNYAASVYLGDLLVTCYSLYSRNRTFGNYIGKGYSVQAIQLEMNMVAEGYNASKCMHNINQHIGAKMPIADTVYKILWQHVPPAAGFNYLESILV